MIEVSMSEAKSAFSEYVNRAAYGGERIVISSRGKPKAVMISVADLERLEELEDGAAAALALADYEAGETISWEAAKAVWGEGNAVPA